MAPAGNYLTAARNRNQQKLEQEDPPAEDVEDVASPDDGVEAALEEARQRHGAPAPKVRAEPAGYGKGGPSAFPARASARPGLGVTGPSSSRAGGYGRSLDGKGGPPPGSFGKGGFEKGFATGFGGKGFSPYEKGFPGKGFAKGFDKGFSKGFADPMYGLGGVKRKKAPPKPVDVDEQWGIKGLTAAVKEAIAAFGEGEEDFDADDIAWKVCKAIKGGIDKYRKDGRASSRGTPFQAQALVAEFVEAVMASMTTVAEKTWYREADFSGALELAVSDMYSNSKLFTRTLRTQFPGCVQEALFRFREEERVLRMMWEVVELSGLPETYHKKCYNGLAKSYDEAHISAPYGTHEADEELGAEGGTFRDFVHGWMSEFCHRSWDVLEGGLSSKDEQMTFLTMLFQNLTHPERACYPYDLASTLDAHPPVNWPVVAEMATTIFMELEESEAKAAAKKARTMGW